MDLTEQTLWIPALLLTAARFGGLMLIAPAFANSAVPVKVRYLIAVVLAAGALGRLSGPVAMPSSVAALAVAAGGEVLIGGVIGLAARVVLSGVELAAVQISRQLGITLGAMFDPSGDTGDPVMRLMYLLAVVVFFAIGGHRVMLSGLLATLQTVPPGSAVLQAGMVEMIAALLAASFVLAVKLAAPVVVALLVVAVATGVVSRTVGQLNVLTVGLPLRNLVGLGVLAVSLGAMLGLLERATDWISRAAALAPPAGQMN